MRNSLTYMYSLLGTITHLKFALRVKQVNSMENLDLPYYESVVYAVLDILGV